MQTRRQFLARAAATLAGSTAVPAALLATHAPWLCGQTLPSTAAAGAMARSFADYEAAIGTTEVAFDRALPATLSGTLYRNGPARMRRGATEYRHWFDGDGMVQALTLSGNRLRHRGAMVQTTRSRIEEAAGRFLWPSFGTGFADARAVTQPDDVNAGNISVLPLGEDLLALWEGGSAWRMDPATLATRGRKVFSDETDGASFSAHPRVDPDGRIWNFGYASGSGKLLLYDIDRSGSLRRHALIDAPNADMVHDFAVTPRHLVFVLTPVLRRDGKVRGSGAFAEALQWHADKPAWLLVVDKSTLAVTHRVELPNFFCFHLGNAWLDGGALRVQVARTLDFDLLMTQIFSATRGDPVSRGRVGANAMEIVLDLASSRAVLQDLPLPESEFPRWDPRRTGLSTRKLLMLGRDDRAAHDTLNFNTLQWFDRRSASVTRFSYGSHAVAEEHVYVPRAAGAEGEGWIIGTALDWKAQRTSLSVFDAQALDAGPIATAHLPYTLPLGLHGQFVAG